MVAAQRLSGAVSFCMRMIPTLILLLAAATPAVSQDERTIVSPDDQLEFHLRVAVPEPGALNQIAYQVRYRGKLLIDTSFLGLDVLYQPLLGAKLGLLNSRTSKTAHYQSLTAQYMQDGSTGRLINIEARVYNDGVAFRYVVPPSSPLEDLRLEGEETEFRLPHLDRIPAETPLPLPFVMEEPGVGWVSIQEVPHPNYGRMSLLRVGSELVSRIAKNGRTPDLAFDGKTPLTGPWRVIVIGATRPQLDESKILGSLE
jgi:alpha-glucosidase